MSCDFFACSPPSAAGHKSQLCINALARYDFRCKIIDFDAEDMFVMEVQKSHENDDAGESAKSKKIAGIRRW